MFASTYYGAQIHPRRSVIIPCLHDEAYARLSIFRPLLRNVRALLFNSEAEQRLAQQLLGDVPAQIRRVVGMGIDDSTQPGNEPGNAERFRSKYGIDAPFVLYVGRREPGKNTPLLLHYWQSYVANKQRDPRLVLIGPGQVQITPELAPYVLDLGFVPEQDKRDAYAAAAVLCQPSLHESFSIVLMESWRARTPVLVHQQCAVTLNHVQRSNGGLYFSSPQEFAATIDFLLDNHEISQILGQQGRQYVMQNFVWDVIVNKYRTLLAELEQRSPAPLVSKP
jgi:glycosyltransferase involved in cell wall biosynthesis